MKILFCTRHFGCLRNFESVITLMADRGYQIHLAADREDSVGGRQMVERLAARYAGISIGCTPPRGRDPWLEFATAVRLGQDYLRYLERPYDRAPKIRQRAKQRTPRILVWLIEQAGFRYRPGRYLLRAVLARLEDAIPVNTKVAEFLIGQEPDVVLLTPLVDLGSPQLDLLAGAKHLGLRTTLCVGSWDHLSSKALIRIVPDLITVWNDIQRQEAVEMHGVPAEQVAVTGAQCFDQWFDRQPSQTRDEFCHAMGLPIDRPFLLYVCSSLFKGEPPESRFVERWVNGIRSAADQTLQQVGVLVRPHPGRLNEWADVDRRAWTGVAWHGGNPIDERSKADYFDALHYSAAVVGLNTSAFLEASVVGRSVHTILDRDYWKSQEGTLHFHYLLTAGGGVLQTARSLDEHYDQLAGVLRTKAEADRQRRHFLEAFIRPQGLAHPSTPVLVEAVERLAESTSPAPGRMSAMGLVLRLIIACVLRVSELPRTTRKIWKDFRHARRKNMQRVRRILRPVLRRYVEHPLAETRRLVLPRTVRAHAWQASEFDTLEEVRLVRETITELGRSRQPIIVGPWVSETGFELLYWIPFLRWAKVYGNVHQDRIVVISRGGAAPWYRDVSTSYSDLFDHISLDEFNHWNGEQRAREVGQKQFEMTVLDQEILDRVRTSRRLRRAKILHPSLMYHLFRPFWLQRAPASLVQRFCIHRRLPAPRVWPLDLPERYVAVKFYSNDALPLTADNAAFVQEMLAKLSKRYQVVLLSTGTQFDEHQEFSLGRHDRIIPIGQLMTPRTNLEVQTAVIAGAQAVVGTYGGFSYLGPLCGVNTLTFYSNPEGFRFDHLELATRAFRQVDGGQFVSMQATDLDVINFGFGRAKPVHAVP